MFTIKVMEDGGYTAYSCGQYSVRWMGQAGGDGPTSIPVILFPETKEREAMSISVMGAAYIENASGKTIDHLESSGGKIKEKCTGSPIGDVAGSVN